MCLYVGETPIATFLSLGLNEASLVGLLVFYCYVIILSQFQWLKTTLIISVSLGMA